MLVASKTPKVEWSDETQQSFESLKLAMSSDPILKAPEVKKSFFVQCDASERAIGCALFQEGVDGTLFSVAYQSRKLQGAEVRYPVIEKEALSIVNACHVFRSYLIGTHFVLLTDLKPLIAIKQAASRNSRVYRWSLSLEDLDFEVNFVPGYKNTLADYLSRPPQSG